jgi:fumarate reductase subunit C
VEELRISMKELNPQAEFRWWNNTNTKNEYELPDCGVQPTVLFSLELISSVLALTKLHGAAHGCLAMWEQCP